MWTDGHLGPNSTSMSAKTKVFYDGSCPLCVAEIAHYKARDTGGHLALVDVSKPVDLPSGLTPDAAMARFHVQTPDGVLQSGARGFAALWDRVPGWRWLARLSRIPGVLTLLEGVYRGFLVLRPALVRVFVALTKKGPRKAP